MHTIMVLNDEQTWSALDGCMQITLSDEAMEELCEVDRFHCDIPIIEQKTLSERDTDWEDVARMFYNACGGKDNNPPADADWLDDLLQYWSGHFHIEEDEDE